MDSKNRKLKKMGFHLKPFLTYLCAFITFAK